MNRLSLGALRQSPKPSTSFSIWFLSKSLQVKLSIVIYICSYLQQLVSLSNVCNLHAVVSQFFSQLFTFLTILCHVDNLPIFWQSKFFSRCYSFCDHVILLMVQSHPNNICAKWFLDFGSLLVWSFSLWSTWSLFNFSYRHTCVPIIIPCTWSPHSISYFTYASHLKLCISTLHVTFLSSCTCDFSILLLYQQ